MSDDSAMEGGLGHNSENRDKVVWERWTKKRTFVRALEGTYGQLKEELYSQPRVYRTSDLKWKGGPQHYGKKVINPQANRIAQSIEAHVEVFSPKGYGQTHGHMNSAVFLVLKGKGHDVHDGRRIDWETGDALIVENACVHQHLNDSDEEGLILVLKAKPLFLFMHMIFQKMVQYPPEKPVPGHEDYTPPENV
ncbi:cupin domain-containing protein [Roseibium marinum]|uniref:Cupin domain-containing protein n=1 Tax=Roseibium marinum TaxID=281252 RepID=A0A2S3V4D6_9HYPH|nr:cupin domain-containing protein [Roseibium marinum]POF34529.1 Cupin domain-containing protein [Roseibium marinum]